MRTILTFALLLNLFSFSGAKANCADKLKQIEDPFLYLEDINSPENLKWVDAQNQETINRLKNDPRYSAIEREIKDSVLSKDKIPGLNERKGYFYNFWTDGQNPKGLWRRIKSEDFIAQKETWEVILDIDKLSQEEGIPWVFNGTVRMSDDLFLVKLSNGGTDAVQLREFNIKSKKFITDGYFINQSKLRVSAIDENNVVIGSDFGHGSMTNSGYPREVRIWKRGQKLKDATLLYKAEKTDVSASGWVAGEGKEAVVFVDRAIDFYTSQTWYLDGEVLRPVNLPHDSSIQGYYKNKLVVLLKSDWSLENKNFKQGDIIYLGYKKSEPQNPELLFRPTESQAVDSVAVSKNAIFISYLDNVVGKILKISFNQRWTNENVNLPANGAVSISFADEKSDFVHLKYESFLKRQTLYSLKDTQIQPEIIRSLKSLIDDSLYEQKQLWATSKDGTRVPYFLIAKKGMSLNKKNPTLVYGYGGFEISNLPYYLNSWFTTWLDQGGVYVLTNIRGGGEFGPKWHQAALKENRQKAYDDFIATIEDVQAKGYTSPQNTAIMGGSNGGLLVGAVYVQRPELMNAVICQVPLLDMLRYSQLLAGASWMGEYGNPDDPQMRDIILKYSPYQNLKPDVKYPEVMFVTSTKDDRVHPGHARKMYAKMKQYGHSALYYENINGGHSAASDLNERVQRTTMERIFLWQKLK